MTIPEVFAVALRQVVLYVLATFVCCLPIMTAIAVFNITGWKLMVATIVNMIPAWRGGYWAMETFK